MSEEKSEDYEKNTKNNQNEAAETIETTNSIIEKNSTKSIWNDSKNSKRNVGAGSSSSSSSIDEKVSNGNLNLNETTTSQSHSNFNEDNDDNDLSINKNIKDRTKSLLSPTNCFLNNESVENNTKNNEKTENDSYFKISVSKSPFQIKSIKKLDLDEVKTDVKQDTNNNNATTSKSLSLKTAAASATTGTKISRFDSPPVTSSSLISSKTQKRQYETISNDFLLETNSTDSDQTTNLASNIIKSNHKFSNSKLYSSSDDSKSLSNDDSTTTTTTNLKNDLISESESKRQKSDSNDSTINFKINLSQSSSSQSSTKTTTTASNSETLNKQTSSSKTQSVGQLDDDRLIKEGEEESLLSSSSPSCSKQMDTDRPCTSKNIDMTNKSDSICSTNVNNDTTNQTIISDDDVDLSDVKLYKPLNKETKTKSTSKRKRDTNNNNNNNNNSTLDESTPNSQSQSNQTAIQMDSNDIDDNFDSLSSSASSSSSSSSSSNSTDNATNTTRTKTKSTNSKKSTSKNQNNSSVLINVNSPDYWKKIYDTKYYKENSLNFGDILNKELGFSGRFGHGHRNNFGLNFSRTKTNQIYNQQLQTRREFINKSISKLSFVQKMKLYQSLSFHDGCVNALNFNRIGTLLASGSDDYQVCLWDWTRKSLVLSFDSGHKSNVFQAKFMPFTGDSQIVTCARDGQVRLALISSSGTHIGTKKLAKHADSCHKLSIECDSPNLFLSCGEDAVVYEIDLRQNTPARILTVKTTERNFKIPLYSISSNPLNTYEFLVSGKDPYIRVYDKRMLVENRTKILNKYSPVSLRDSQRASVTSAVYNYNGTEIIGSYSDDDIYLFETNQDPEKCAKYRYKGHRNSETIKGVNFYGSNSDFVISGSDCGHIFFWEKTSQQIVQVLKGDEHGVVNVLETHPNFPILATSGLDSDIKIWAPESETPNSLETLADILKDNQRVRNTNRNFSLSSFEFELLLLLMHRPNSRVFVRSTGGDLVINRPNRDAENNNADGDTQPSETRTTFFRPFRIGRRRRLLDVLNRRDRTNEENENDDDSDDDDDVIDEDDDDDDDYNDHDDDDEDDDVDDNDNDDVDDVDEEDDDDRLTERNRDNDDEDDDFYNYDDPNDYMEENFSSVNENSNRDEINESNHSSTVTFFTRRFLTENNSTNDPNSPTINENSSHSNSGQVTSTTTTATAAATASNSTETNQPDSHQNKKINKSTKNSKPKTSLDVSDSSPINLSLTNDDNNNNNNVEDEENKNNQDKNNNYNETELNEMD